LVKVGYEKYGMQADIEYFQLEMQRTGEAFAIEELAWPREGDHSKWSRFERLEPDIRDGRFYFPALIAVKGQGRLLLAHGRGRRRIRQRHPKPCGDNSVQSPSRAMRAGTPGAIAISCAGFGARTPTASNTT
jgi:hypothetical protein